MSDPKLKEAMAEIKGVLQKHNIAGYISIVSETHSEFLLHVTPTWSAFKWEDDILRFRVKEKEVGKQKAKALSELSCHIIYQIRDLCAQGFIFAENMTQLIETQLEVEHKSFDGYKPNRES